MFCFWGEWSKRNNANLARILGCFYVSSCLEVNFNKSKVHGIGSLAHEVITWTIPLACELSSLPFTYLGILLGMNMNRKASWNPIMEKLKAKPSVWKEKTLNFGGRITLTKVVIGSLPTYYMSIWFPGQSY